MRKLDNTLQERKYIRAKKRVKEIKGFYKHLIVYIFINFFFIGKRIYNDIVSGDSIIEAFTDINNYKFFFWWGIALLIHGITTFGILNLFGKDWEERKIKELMGK